MLLNSNACDGVEIVHVIALVLGGSISNIMVYSLLYIATYKSVDVLDTANKIEMSMVCTIIIELRINVRH